MNKKKDKLEDVIYYMIEQTDRKSKAHSTQAFQQAGIDITVEQWVLLKLIEQNPEISQNELAEKATKDAASITRMLDILQKKDFVQRLAAPDDRRKYLLALTAEGRALIDQHMDLVIGLRKKGVKGFSKQELELLKEMLLRIQTNLK
jgi:MarR family transcriptional regulator, transcriptional regulator for hemolysin